MRRGQIGSRLVVARRSNEQGRVMPRIHELVGLIAGVFALALIGLQPCGAAEPAPRDGDSVIMATSAQVQGFDPLTTRAANRETTMAGALVFSKFFTLDEQGKRVPDLATSLDSSPDGLTWRLKLRPGVKFSNGAPYTARDVAHHFQRILDPSKNQAFAAALGALKEGCGDRRRHGGIPLGLSLGSIPEHLLGRQLPVLDDARRA